MWTRIRQATLYFLIGFTIAFVIYLFVRFDSDLVLVGVGISSVVGLVLSAVLLWLEHRYPEPRDRVP